MLISHGGHEGITNCYVFKSQLQEYTMKEQLPNPVYETLKEGTPQEPLFKSTVVVNNVAYESLPGFFNRKSAEQSAAEIALRELAKTRSNNGPIPSPVHETGLCKNVLQEYAQRMNYAVPSYVCSRVDQSVESFFWCTVEIAGMQYIGAPARTKKEAEVKAARTALLAIQANTTNKSEAIPGENSQLIVVPCKRKGTESHTPEKTILPLQPKKTQMKKKRRNKNHPKNKGDQEKSCPMEVTINTGNSSEVSGGFVSSQASQAVQPGGVEIKCVSGLDMESNNQQDQHASVMQSNGNEQGSSNAETLPAGVEMKFVSGCDMESNNQQEQHASDMQSNGKEQGSSNAATLSGLPVKDSPSLVSEVSTVSGAVQVVLQTLSDSAMGSLVAGSNQNEDERSTVDELKQRIGEPFQSSQSHPEPMDVMNQS